jgi:hypothetical protein
MVTINAILQELTQTTSPNSGALVETWQYKATIPVRVYKKKIIETIKEIRYYKTTTTILTKYPFVTPVNNRLQINDELYIINDVVEGVWYTLTSYTIKAC